MNIVYYIMIFGVLNTLWPLILPLFFIPDNHNKYKSYFVLLLFVYGLIGLVNAPIALINVLFELFNLPSIGVVTVPLGLVIGFILAIVGLKKYGIKLVSAIVVDKNA